MRHYMIDNEVFSYFLDNLNFQDVSPFIRVAEAQTYMSS